MKKLIIAIALFVAQGAYAAEEYGLEGLMDSKGQDSPPSAISAIVRKKEKKELDYCQNEKHYTKQDMKEFFGAIVLDLNKDGQADYLLYPKKYCFNMFGAHAIPYWIVLSSPKGYRLAKTGATDVVKVIDSKTNGTRDIVDIYGQEETKYVFDGKTYIMVE